MVMLYVWHVWLKNCTYSSWNMFPMPLLRFPLQSPGTAHYVYQFGQAVQQFPQQQQQQQQHPMVMLLTYNVDQGQQHLVLTGPPSQQHQPQPSGSGNLLMPMYNVVNMPPPAQGAVSISTTPKHLQPPSVVTQTLMHKCTLLMFKHRVK